MAYQNNNNQYDEFRVLVQPSSSSSQQNGKPSRFSLYVSILSVIIVLAIGIFAIIKWHPIL